jgi:hypothetical protein
MSGKRNTQAASPKSLRRKATARRRTTAIQALQAAKDYLLRNATFDVCDSRTHHTLPYNCDDCWFIYPRFKGDAPAVGASQVIAISKKNGKVVFCGDAGE